jgi:hypothetical protein
MRPRECSATAARSHVAFARVLLCLVALCGLAACTTRSYAPLEVDRRLGQAVASATAHLSLREMPETAQLVRAIERIDPTYPDLAKLRDALPADVQDLFAATGLGMNRARRVTVPRGVVGRVVRYLPDRLRDLFDVVSLDAHSGVGLYADVHLTRGAQLSAGARVAGGLGVLPQRATPGFQLQANGGFHAFGAGAERFYGVVAGPGGVYTGSTVLRGLQSPGDRLYQDYRDYWAIGASGTVGVFGATAELRPVQLADFVLGFVGIDIANDDSATSRPLDLLQSERELLEELGRIAASEESVAEYRARVRPAP